jgi:hypothetical protein
MFSFEDEDIPLLDMDEYIRLLDESPYGDEDDFS